jgi:hypothetical protein
MKTIAKCLFPSDLTPGEYAYPEVNRRYYAKRLETGAKCGVVSRMFGEGGALWVDTYGGATSRVTGHDLEYQLCVE